MRLVPRLCNAMEHASQSLSIDVRQSGAEGFGFKFMSLILKE